MAQLSSHPNGVNRYIRAHSPAEKAQIPVRTFITEENCIFIAVDGVSQNPLQLTNDAGNIAIHPVRSAVQIKEQLSNIFFKLGRQNRQFFTFLD